MRKLNVKTNDYTSILGSFPEKYNFLKKTWDGYINFLTDDIGSCDWKSPLRKKHVKRKHVFSEINRHMLTIEIETEQTVEFKNVLQFFSTLLYNLVIGRFSSYRSLVVVLSERFEINLQSSLDKFVLKKLSLTRLIDYRSQPESITIFFAVK